MQEILRTTDVPIFGFCGGWQLAATALGAELTPIEVREAQRNGEIIVEWAVVSLTVTTLVAVHLPDTGMSLTDRGDGRPPSARSSLQE